MKKMMSAAGYGLLVLLLLGTPGLAAEITGPEETLRALVQANADKDVSTLARYMAHDVDIVGYTIGGRRKGAWSQSDRGWRRDSGAGGGSEIRSLWLRC